MIGALRSPEVSFAGRLAILPVGSCEAHGPHLPLDTDARIAVAVAERAARRVGGMVLPALPYGVTRFARNFPGTLGVSAAFVTRGVVEIARAALDAGASGVALSNAHFEPAHIDALFAACAEEPRIRFVNVASKRNSARLRAAVLDGHSGIYETSLMLAIAPELVVGHGALEAVSASLAEGIAAGADCFEAAGGPRAYFGDPGRATAEIGERLLEELGGMV